MDVATIWHLGGRHRRSRHRRAPGSRPISSLAGQASVARRPCPPGRARRQARALLRASTASGSSRRRRARPGHGSPARRASSAWRRRSGITPRPRLRGPRARSRRVRSAVRRRPTACRFRSGVSPWRISKWAPSCSADRAWWSKTWTATTPIDLAGLYGLNVFGYDFYRDCIDARDRAGARSRPVWAPTIRSSRRTSRRLCAISGLDEVSFHMSGTEAVMQAVRLARYHTGRSHLVRSAARTTAGGTASSRGGQSAAGRVTSTR